MTVRAVAGGGGAPMVRAWALYAVVATASIALAGWLLTLAFSGPRDATAIRLSALVALAVQLAAFAVTKMVAARHLVAGWGAGSLIRFLALGLYALLAVKVLGLAPVAALVSLATFLFISTLIEPFFLKR
jgi:hypothetical protein